MDNTGDYWPHERQGTSETINGKCNKKLDCSFLINQIVLSQMSKATDIFYTDLY